MSVDADRLRKESVYESQAPLGIVTMDLSEIERLAAGWRASRKRCLIWGIVLLVLGLLLLMIPPLGILLILIAIGLFFWMKKFPKNVAGGLDRCTAARAVADMLNHDTAAQQPITFRLAFNPKPEVLSEVPMPHARNGKQKLSKISWFSVEASLLDGTMFSQTIDDMVRTRSFTSASGKSKTKNRTHSVIAMRFAYPPDVYGNVTPLGERLQKELQLPKSVLMKQFDAGEKQVKVKAVVTQPNELAQTSPLLALGVYRMLNLSRRLVGRAHRTEGGTK